MAIHKNSKVAKAKMALMMGNKKRKKEIKGQFYFLMIETTTMEWQNGTM